MDTFVVSHADKEFLRRQIFYAKRKNVWKNHKRFKTISNNRFIKSHKSIYYIKLSIPIFFNNYISSLMKLEIYRPGKTKETWYYLFEKRYDGRIIRKKIARFEQNKFR